MFTQFKQYLETKGIIPENEVEEQITFFLEGLYYLFVYEKTDPYYFRIILPSIFKIDGDKTKYYELVNDFNQKFKVVKLTITNGDMLWLAAEQFFYSCEKIDLLFERCITALRLVYNFFKEEQDKTIL